MKDLRFAKTVVLLNALIPGVLLLWDALHGQAGANPVNYAIRTTGLLALIFLTLSLLVTPLRKITGMNWLFHVRRLLGLYAFFYALAHFAIFFVFDRALNVRSTLSEMVKRPYLVVGSIGLFAMVPLAVTSTNYMIKRLGPNRWRTLHRLAYLAAIAGVVHFYMLVKSDIRLPIAFGSVVGVLLGYRLFVYLIRRFQKSSGASATQSANVASDVGRWAGQLRVEQIIQETPDVKTFRLASTDGSPLPFTYLPGQYLTVTLPIGGKTIRRSYTIASTPTRLATCEVTVKREELGRASRHWHDTVKQSDLLSIAAPAGRFTFTGAGSNAIALLAAGVGITPLMSILRYLTDQKWNGQIYLIYSNKHERDIIFREEIELLQAHFHNLHLTLTLTRAEGTNWKGVRGRIDAALLKSVIPNVTAIPFYICGPAEMITSMREMLRAVGIAEDHIHFESFGTNFKATSIEGATSDGSDAFKVTFSRSNRSATINSNEPILACAEQFGIDVDSECRSGICGRCKYKLLSGSVRMETQEALDDADRQNGLILLCQAMPTSDVAVQA